MFNLAASDIARKRKYYVRIDNFVNRYLKISFQLGTIAVLVYRLGAWAERAPQPVRTIVLTSYFIANALSATFTGVGINRKTPIGKGFVVHNFSNVNVDAERVGENFTVNQGVSVGSDFRWQSRHGGRPVIGNNVFLGAGAKVLGAVTVGNNVMVAANALVERSVPDNCSVVGVPARIIARDSGSDYLHFTS
jgi:serine O-acetyltransferase